MLEVKEEFIPPVETKIPMDSPTRKGLSVLSLEDEVVG